MCCISILKGEGNDETKEVGEDGYIGEAGVLLHWQEAVNSSASPVGSNNYFTSMTLPPLPVPISLTLMLKLRPLTQVSNIALNHSLIVVQLDFYGHWMGMCKWHNYVCALTWPIPVYNVDGGDGHCWFQKWNAYIIFPPAKQEIVCVPQLPILYFHCYPTSHWYITQDMCFRYPCIICNFFFHI